MFGLAVRPWAAAVLAALFLAQPALACDICAVYTGFEVQTTEVGFRLGLGEQFTHFDTLQNGGVEVANPDDEHMNSSITQFLFGYQFLRWLGVQVAVPVISRSYRRATDAGIESGDVSGFGDLSLFANVLAYNYTSEETVALVTVFAGLQLPSGDSALLGEEVPAPTPTPCHGRGCFPSDNFQSGRPLFVGKHIGGATSVPSGIHGHDLALGSGSVDGLLGAHGFASWKRLYGDLSLQYSINSAGSFDYKYANELLIDGGPGVFLLAEDEYTLGLQALLTMQTKGNDTVGDLSTDDTAFTGFYAGPALRLTWSSRLSADIGADLPAIRNNSGLQIVPNYRVRMGVVWRF
jgi:hypothetical protein